MPTDSIAISSETLKRLFVMEVGKGLPLFPELDKARQDIPGLRRSLQAKLLLEASEELMADPTAIPLTTYTLYRQFRNTGERRGYEAPYFHKRSILTAAALRLFLGEDKLLDAVQDYIWNICEETTWVLPAHEWVKIDLFSAETGFMLAQLLTALNDKLAEEVQKRVRDEIERRIFAPYLEFHETFGWYKGHSNWNGVCNGSVGSTFLLLERDESRLAEAVSAVLAGLDTFIHTAFEDDGASTEGSGYWGYGLIHYVDFAELLRQRTAGQIDILSGERMKAIAAYPTHVMLSPAHYASFSDCAEVLSFQPGFIMRLAERSGVSELRRVLARPVLSAGPADLYRDLLDWDLTAILHTLLWWDGQFPEAPGIGDSYLPNGGVVRLVAETSAGTPVVTAIKAGHNAENHNQNDVGSFIVHAGGETFLCDPGTGLYSRQYFSSTRYENIFANSFGHSVPCIGGQLQSAGREFEGQVLGYAPEGEPKKAVLEIGKAYSVPGLGIHRELALAAKGRQAGTIKLQDTFTFAEQPQQVEEAFVTWLDVEVSGATAILHGKTRDLHLTIEEPAGASFSLAVLAEECKANAKEGVLKRLTFTLPAAASGRARVRMTWKPG